LSSTAGRRGSTMGFARTQWWSWLAPWWPTVCWPGTQADRCTTTVAALQRLRQPAKGRMRCSATWGRQRHYRPEQRRTGGKEQQWRWLLCSTAMANMLCPACVRTMGEARSECECVGEDGRVGGARSCGRGGLERQEQQQRLELRSAMVVSAPVSRRAREKWRKRSERACKEHLRAARLHTDARRGQGMRSSGGGTTSHMANMPTPRIAR
jgi:hypothetical protein